jgi:choline dehydrogenase-like flavoprotein
LEDVVNGPAHEFVVVGSGMGGSTLALELARRGKEVLILESGVWEPKLGTFKDTLRYYDGNALTQTPKKSKEGVILWRTLMAGGSAMVSCGNGVRALQRELAERGIDLEQDFAEIEKEMGVAPIAERLLSDGSLALAAAAKELGYRLDRMPKFIDADKCDKCGNCALGCKHGARWATVDQLTEFEGLGGEIVYKASVERVTGANGAVSGVEALIDGRPATVNARCVVLAAGGLGTPVILQKSGIHAGEGLFMDLLVNVYGATRGLNQVHEPTMALVDTEFHEDQGFILSPFMNHARGVRSVELGLAGMTMSSKKLIGLQTKTKDERAGQVFADGSVSKPVLPTDQKKLDAGASVAREILVKAGADPKSIVVSRVQGAHPGGTAAIGEVVDQNLETKMSGLFCCDASVLPVTPGLPPMLTIGALAKNLARKLAD